MAQSRRAAPPPRLSRSTLLVAIAVGAGLVAAWFYFGARGVEEGPARDGAPSWSGDGRRIVFIAEVGTSPADIFVMNADGTGRQRLTDTPAAEANPAFSPDSTRIAFESNRDGNSEIYVMDADGRNVRRLTSDPATDQSPAWSPDGTHLAFMSDRNNRASTDIYTMSAADGSGLERLTTDLANWAPQFSPDGRELAMQVNRDVQVIDLASKALRRLTSDPDNGMNPTWSPDGRRIAFVTTRNGRAQIFGMNADGSDQKALVTRPNGSVIDARWSPDGAHLAFVFIPEQPPPGQPADSQAMYTIDLTSGQLVRLSR